MGTIYRIWNSANAKSYIGHATDEVTDLILARFRADSPLWEDVLEFDVDVWHWEILEEDCSDASVNELYREYIEKYDAFHNGYNSHKSRKIRIPDRRPRKLVNPPSDTEIRAIIIKRVTEYKHKEQERKEWEAEVAKREAERQEEEAEQEAKRQAEQKAAKQVKDEDAQRVLGLQPNFTPSDLENVYRKYMLLFKAVREAYAHLHAGISMPTEFNPINLDEPGKYYLIPITDEVLEAREKALHLRTLNGVKFWIPKSAIITKSQSSTGSCNGIVVLPWFIEQYSEQSPPLGTVIINEWGDILK